MKTFVFFVAIVLFGSLTFLSVSEHNEDTPFRHKQSPKKIAWDHTRKWCRAQDVNAPLSSKTLTWVVQYALVIRTGPNENRDGQHHWVARAKVKNTDEYLHGHFLVEIVCPYLPAGTITSIPPKGKGKASKPFKGVFSERVPRPFSAKGVLTTTVPYDVNKSICHCEAWGWISGWPRSIQGNPPENEVKGVDTFIPWYE